MRERAFLAAALVCGLGLSSGARAEVVSLEELEERALSRHVSVLASEARERAAAAGVREAQSGYLPRIGVQIDASAMPGRRIFQVESAQGEDILVQGTNAISLSGASSDENKRAIKPVFRTTALVSLQQTLYDFGRTRAAVEVSRARHQASRAEGDVSRQEVVASVRAAYLTWLSAAELYKLALDASADATRRSQRVSALIAEGARPRGDLAPVESDRLLSQLELERAEGDLESARLSLAYVIGEPLSESAEPDRALLEREPASTNTQPDPALRLLAFQRAALEATARLQRRAGMPALTAGLGAGFGVQPDPLRFLPSYQVGVGLAIPIWDGGGSDASAQATEARIDEMRLRMEDAESALDQEHAKAALEAEHALRRKATASQLIEVCLARVGDTETGYDLGAMQFEQVQAARSMLRRAQTELVMAQVAHAEAVLRVSR